VTRDSSDSGQSNPIGVILLVVVTIALAALVLALIIQMPKLGFDPPVPTIFEITKLRHTGENGVLNYDSYMVVKNRGTTAYDNTKLYAKTYRNGELLPCVIPYINFNKYIRDKPYGIQTIGGFGTDDYAWSPDASIFIDYSDRTFYPGDNVRFEVYDRDTNQILSTDTWPHTEETNQERMMKLFLSHQGA